MDELDTSMHKPNARRDILYHYLLENSNKDHPVNSDVILDFLATRNINIDRKTLISDIDTLRETVDIQSSKKGYSIVENPFFEEYELRLFLDSLQSASFIMPDTRAALTTKLLRFTDKYTRKELLDKAISMPHQDADNDNDKALNMIYEAIREDCKISFKYPCMRNEPGDFKTVTASPYAVVSDGKRYLLFSHCEPIPDTKTEKILKDATNGDYELLEAFRKTGMTEEYESLKKSLSNPDNIKQSLILIETDAKKPQYKIRGGHIFLFLIDRMKAVSLLHAEKRELSDEILFSVMIDSMSEFESYSPDTFDRLIWHFIDDEADEVDE